LRLKLLAVIAPTLRFDSQFRILYSGIGPTVANSDGYFGAGNHWYSEQAAAIPIFVEKSLLTWESADLDRDGYGMTFKAGIMNLDELVQPGTSFTNHFASEAWVGHG